MNPADREFKSENYPLEVLYGTHYHYHVNKQGVLTQRCFNIGPVSVTMTQY